MAMYIAREMGRYSTMMERRSSVRMSDRMAILPDICGQAGNEGKKRKKAMDNSNDGVIAFFAGTWPDGTSEGNEGCHSESF